VSFSWTDSHGVAQCPQCGAPYRIYHYGEDGKRIDKPPEIAALDWAVPALREHWQTTKRIAPGGHSFPGGQELCSHEDAEAFGEWFRENKARFAPGEDQEAPKGGG